MDLSITSVHLDLGAGRRGTDMGPSAILVAGLVEKLRALGHDVQLTEPVEAPTFERTEVTDTKARFLPEILATCTLLHERVAEALSQGRAPLVLGGDHAIAMGSVSAVSRHYRARGEEIGVVWVDAHTDMNTPETTPSGNIHGMPLAVLLGRGVPSLVALSGDRPALRPENVAIIGARQVDRREVALVRELGVTVFTMSDIDRRGIGPCVEQAFDQVSKGTAGVHLSWDLDGVDPEYAPGVGTPVPGGLTLRESHLISETVALSGKLIGMDMVELNPTLDHRNATGKLAVWLIESALGRRIL